MCDEDHPPRLRERPVARRIVKRTAELANAFSAKVLVTSVAPVLLTRGQGPWDPADPPSRHRKEVDHAVARLTELGVTDVKAVVTTGDPSHAIVELADERKADLIVLGAHEGALVSRVSRARSATPWRMRRTPTC